MTTILQNALINESQLAVQPQKLIIGMKVASLELLKLKTTGGNNHS